MRDEQRREAYRGRDARPSESDVLETVDSELKRKNGDTTVVVERAKETSERAKELSKAKFWRGGRAVEGARLESVCTHRVPWVRIPPSP
jgi:hypothetical protein